jgi:hypothetical protein
MLEDEWEDDEEEWPHEDEIEAEPSKPYTCYFCGAIHTTIVIHEHYMFCKDCTALYTFHYDVTGCEHVENKPVPRALRLPWYEKARIKPYYNSRCSVCKKRIRADGW